MIPPPLPARSGVGLKPEHGAALLAAPASVGFVEVHAENYMGEGGAPHRLLTRVRERLPLSLHGVALSIGADGPLDREHLLRLAALCARYEPASFSEHLAWSTHEDATLNDLLPVPYDARTLATVCDHIDEVQETLGRRMLLENPTSYLLFESSTMSETDFLAEVVRRTGCGLLLDVANVRASAVNLGFDARAYLAAFPLAHVGEIHLAGQTRAADDGGPPLVIDAHASPVDEEVWALFRAVVAEAGPRPTLIERDGDVPPFDVLAAEAARADAILAAAEGRRAPRVAA